MKKQINTPLAPEAIGPYSQAVEINGWLFVSGQIPMDEKGKLVSNRKIGEQTTQVLKNIRAILIAAGSSLEDVVKTTCYLSDMNLFAEMNEVYKSHFKGIPPARATVEVSRLPKDVLIEIDAIAIKEN